MRTVALRFSGTGMLVLLLAVIGCSGGESSVAPSPLGSSAERSAFRAPALAELPNQSDGVYPPWTGRVIATDFPGENVDIFSATGKPESQLTGFNGVKGLTLDASGNLYVIATSSLIFEYESDLATRSNVLYDNQHPGEYANDISVAPDGTVGITNQYTFNDNVYGPGSVSFFAKGATTPCATVSSPTWNGYVDYGAFDKFGNYFVDGVTRGTLVGVVRGGCAAKRIDTLTTANTIAYPSAVKITREGKIAILDVYCTCIYTYDPPVNGNLGAPIATTPIADAGNADDFAFAPGNAYIFVTDSGRGGVFKYPYPAGGAAIKQIAAIQWPTSVALTPSSPPTP